MEPPISVLHVEDDGDFADLAAAYFERVSDDISIDHVEDGAEALSYLREDTVDCILSDYTMPGLNGLELLETVRDEYPDLPYILFTSNGSEALAENALDVGATDYVPKEVEEAVFHLLANRIRNAVGPQTDADGAADESTDDSLEKLPVGVVEINETETVSDANEAARNVLDGGEELAGRDLPDLVEEGDLDQAFLEGYREAVETLSAGEAETVQSEFSVDRDGDDRIYEATYTRRPGAGGSVATILDVTEDRRREENLQRYETILETMPDTVTITDIDGNFLEVHGFEGWSGYTREEILEMDVDETIPPEYEDVGGEAARELWEDDDREKVTYETAVLTKDGEAIPFENHLRFIPSDDDDPAPHIMSVLRNIGDRKEREHQLNVLNETMRELVRAGSAEEMAELVVDTVLDVLDVDLAAVALYDEGEDRLERVAADGATDLLGDDGDTDEGRAWATYQAGEIRRFDDVEVAEGAADAAETADAADVESTDDRDEPVWSELVCPLGEYGILHLGSTDDGSFEDRTVSLAEILAGNVEAALDKVFYREELELLAERERELDLYEQTVEATGDGIAIMNEDIEFLMVNSWFAESVGESKEDLEGTAVDAEESDVIVETPDDLVERWTEMGEEARETGRATFLYESVIDLPRGMHHIENRVTGVRQDDDSLIYVITTRDITERKEREEQIEDLHRSTRRLMAADSTDVVAREVVTAVDSTLGFPASVLRMVDDGGEHLAPVAVTDQARDLLGDRESIPIEGNELGEAFQTGEELLVDDVREHTDALDDTEVRSVLSLPIGDYGLLSIVDGEVGAYEEADLRIAEILTSNAEAAFGRVEREEALRERERTLSRQNERLDQFASVLSHDLRNPLNVAMGRLSFVEEKVDDPEHVEIIDKSLDRMQAIIDDVLTLAREGDEAAELERVDLRQTTKTCWVNVDTGDATLEVDTDRRIMADESRLQQLLENLIRNGIDHVGEDVTIRVGDLEAGFYLEDDGPGISEDEREDVFEAGYSTGDDGTGFGLNIVETIAEAHDWAVAVTDGSDGGARFEFSGVAFTAE